MSQLPASLIHPIYIYIYPLASHLAIRMVVKSDADADGVDRQHASTATTAAPTMRTRIYTELKHPAQEYTASNPRHVEWTGTRSVALDLTATMHH